MRLAPSYPDGTETAFGPDFFIYSRHYIISLSWPREICFCFLFFFFFFMSLCFCDGLVDAAGTSSDSVIRAMKLWNI